jgi:TonB-dependent receptor
MRRAFIAVAVCLLAVQAFAAGAGVVAGRVVDEAGNPLPGAEVAARGTTLRTTSSSDGRFQLVDVPEGTLSIEVSYLGFQPGASEVTVRSGEVASVILKLTPIAFTETVTVQAAPYLEGQAKALNMQLNALNIVNVVASDFIGSFPDSNGAEATQRIPGISIERDQGEGRYVLIRGTEARLNSMMVNGERLPSPEGDIRNVALDVIPADLLAAIEVSKALTADMDADAIGGTVNLITRDAPMEPAVSAAVAYGYNDIASDTVESANASWGQRFADGAVGVIIGGSYLNTDRGSENFEVAYDDGDLDELELRHYTVNRERIGLAATLDGRPSDRTQLKLGGMFNQFDDQEYRRRVRNRVADGRMEREIKDRFESQEISSLRGSVTHLFGGGVQLDAAVSWAYAEEDEPDARYTTFRQKNVTFDPNVSADAIDPDDIQANPLNEDVAKYKLEDVSVEDNITKDEDVVAALNLSAPIASGADFGALLRFGAKARGKEKSRDANTTVFEADGDVYMTDYLDPAFAGRSLIDGRYDTGPFFTTDTAAAILGRDDLDSEHDDEEDLADYDASEDVYAAYALAELYLGDRLTLVPGVRYEDTSISYHGKELVFDEDGDLAGTTPTAGENGYGMVLPSIHLRYRIAETTNLRAAATRTLARPNYYDLVPYQLVLEEDREILRGNAELDATTATNLDLMIERFLPGLGVLSAGVFYKDLSDYIYIFRTEEERGGETYEVEQPRNGEAATLWGVELAYQNRFASLPAPFDGLGLLVNYTYTDSEAAFPDRDGGKATLPGQSEHVGNLALGYEKGRFSGRVSLNYHGKYISEVGGEAAEDVYYDDHLQLDLAASVQVAKTARLVLELNNLTDEPLRYYEGTSDRPIQEEYYSWWGTLGVRLSF